MNPPPESSSGRSRKRSRGRAGPFGGHAVPRDWEEVAVAPDRISAGMLESALKAAGIPVMLNRPPLFAYLGAGGVHGVMVPEGRAGEARGILGEIWDVED